MRRNSREMVLLSRPSRFAISTCNMPFRNSNTLAAGLGVLLRVNDALAPLIVPAGVDRTLFRLAPMLMMSPALMSLAVIPWGESLAARNINVGLLMVFAFGSINVIAMMVGAWSSRNKYAIICSPP